MLTDKLDGNESDTTLGEDSLNDTVAAPPPKQCLAEQKGMVMRHRAVIQRPDPERRHRFKHFYHQEAQDLRDTYIRLENQNQQRMDNNKPTVEPIYSMQVLNFEWMSGWRARGFEWRLHRRWFTTIETLGYTGLLSDELNEIVKLSVNVSIRALRDMLHNTRQIMTLWKFIQWLTWCDKKFRERYMETYPDGGLEENYDFAVTSFGRRLKMIIQQRIMQSDGALMLLPVQAVVPLAMQLHKLRGVLRRQVEGRFMANTAYWNQRQELHNLLGSYDIASFNMRTGWEAPLPNLIPLVQSLRESTCEMLEGVTDIFAEFERDDEYTTDHQYDE